MTAPRRYGVRSLRFKLVLASVVVEVLMLSALIWNSVRITGESIQELLQHRVEALMPLMSVSLAGPLAQRDYATLDERLSRIVNPQSLVYVEVRDELGQIAASRGDLPAVPRLDRSVESAQDVFHQEFDITLAGRAIGRARYGLNVSLLKATLANLRSQGALVASTEIMLSVLLLATLGALLTRHLLTLTQAAGTLAGGNFAVRLPVHGRDEIADVARAFNTMASTLERDIAERRRADEALRESEERFRATFEQAAVGIAQVAPDGRWLNVNQKLCDIVGYSREELLQRTYQDITYPEDLNADLESVQRMLTGELPTYGMEKRYVCKDGLLVWIYLTVGLVRQPTGEAKYFISVVEDITERKQVEAALRESERNLSEAQRIAHIGSWIWNLTGPAKWTDELYRVYGVSPETFTPTVEAFFDLVYPEDRPALQEWFRACSVGESPGDIEFRAVRPDGALRHISCRGELICDTGGRPIRMVGTGQDITERKHAEVDKRHLEQLLMQSQKMEAIGQLTAGIAHDFNNILASVLGYSTLALDQHVPDKSSKLADYLREVQTAGNRARDLIASLLAFSRAGASVRHHVLVEPLIKEVMKTLVPAIGSSIELTTNIGASDAQVLADPVQLYQVIMNLVINARDALGEHGHINVSVRRSHVANGHCAACHADFSGDFVEVAVSDTGPGIPADVLAHIFEPFFTTKATGKGSGLGLSVVHGVVHDCGGHVVVESTPGQGTDMRIVLPEAEAAETAVTTVLAAPAPTQPTESRHILVVDDDAAVAQLIGETLQARGYRVTVYTDSREALDRFVAAPAMFDALISDQTMPELTGVELAKAVRALQPELPIILCTGYSATLSPERATELGVRLFYKPAPFTDLVSMLAELFTAHSTTGSYARVLLVDDDDSMVILITRILEQLHYQVTGASDAKTALATLTSNPREYDVLISDIGLPDRSGLELSRAALQLRPDLPIILTTGALRPGEAKIAHGLGIQDIVLKPNTVQELGTTLDRLVRKARSLVR